MSEESGEARPSRALSTVGGCAILLASILLSGYLAFTSMFIGAELLWDPDDVWNLVDWLGGPVSAARSIARIAAAVAIGICALAVIAVVAAWRRNRVLLGFSGFGGGIMLVTLLGCASLGFGALDGIVDHTREALGPVHLVDPERPGGVGSFEDGVPQTAPPPQSSDAETEVRLLVAAVPADVSSTAVTTSLGGGGDAPFDPADPPLSPVSCAPGPDGGVGSQILFAFEVASDESGSVKRRIMEIWTEAGYPPNDRIRDRHFVSRDAGPILSASIDDRFTIDRKLAIRLESRCL